MARAWILTADNNIQSLVDLVGPIASDVVIVVVGNENVTAGGAVIRIPIPEGVPLECAAPAVVQAVKAEGEDIVLAVNSPAGRVFAGAVAAHLNAPMLNGLKEYTSREAILSRFGGISVENVALTGVTVAIAEGLGAAEGNASEVAAEYSAFEAKIESEHTTSATQSNLATAKRIVSSGRGFAHEDDLKLCDKLAEKLGAERGCSRPLAEGLGWMPRDTYIGISGRHVKPEIYVAIGISGQIQHTAGMNETKTVIAINKDDKAPIFEKCDYGIVGDLYTVVPELIEKI